MRLLMLLCAVLACILWTPSAFADITIGAVTRTQRVNVFDTQIIDTGTASLYPLPGTKTIQASYIDPANSFNPGSNTFAESQMASAYTFDGDVTSPTGHSYDFAIATDTIVGVISGNSFTYAYANSSITFTLEAPTAWHLSESFGDSTSNSDQVFAGAVLYAGTPPTFDNPVVSLLPSMASFNFNSGEASGVLNPGTYTYIVGAGGGDAHESSELTVTTDFSLVETPEPALAFPLFAGTIALIRRRKD